MKKNYEEVKRLDWSEMKIPKALNWSVVGLIFAIVLCGQYFSPFPEFINLVKQTPFLIFLFPVLIIVYLIIHEIIHGLLMKLYSGISPEYGFNGPFVYAKSDAYFSKSPYFILALAPFIIWGMAAVLLGVLLPDEGVWFAIVLLSINLYASRGDLQAVMLLKGLPGDLVIKDEGDSLCIFKPTE